ncbi:hypothetical protein JRI60_26195 [Archangium violaceum]|uniref:hypothetical protein n=1 Tax=Archangium violaceum TaxID=83451 RepID=UPI00195034D4|nr:hypothetical protein [Archangium violaceum]QRO02258.1 hypothetical protein JRI60_26195 [Archangium violaceum]
MRAPLLTLLLLALPPVAAAAPFPVTATPSQVVLGRDMEVSVQVQVPRGTSRLRASASTGSLLPLPATARGVHSYRWVPPDIRYPLLAVLAFWVDSPEGPPEVTTVHIPLLGRTVLDVVTDAGAGAEVVVQIAGTRFGPVRTNRKGGAQVHVEVPPGVREARVLATAKGQQTNRTAPLDVPPERPLLALISPDVLPPDGSGWLVILGEQPVPLSELSLRVRGGGVEERSPGVFRVKPEPGASAVVVEAHRQDGTAAARIVAPVLVPIVAHVSPTPAPPVVKSPPVTETPPQRPAWEPWLDRKNVSFSLLAGGFFAGGDNLGPLLSLGAAYRLPPLGGRFSLEAEVGLRQSRTRPSVTPLGELDSRVVALPIMLSARVLAFERGPLSISGRAGGGTMYFDHQTTTQYSQKQSYQRGQAFMGFLAAQAAWRFGAVSALFELRASHAPARTDQLEAQLGGLSASLGVRYSL